MQIMSLGRLGAVTSTFADGTGNDFGFGSKVDQAVAKRIEAGGDTTLVAEIVHRKNPPRGEGAIAVRVPDNFFDRHRIKLTVGASLTVGLVGGYFLNRWLG